MSSELESVTTDYVSSLQALLDGNDNQLEFAPELSDFLEGFSDDDFAMLEQYELDNPELMIAEDEADLDLLHELMPSSLRDNEGAAPTYLNANPTKVPSGKRHETIHLPLSPASDDSVIECKNGTATVNGIPVGVCDQDVYLSIPIMLGNHIQRADAFSEDVGAKGTGLGFSTLVHSAAILAIANGGIIEPERGDLFLEGHYIEVTGVNYAKRRTEASIVISKYKILEMFSTDLGLQQYLELSHKEDNYDCTGWIGSGIEQPVSPYTAAVRRISKVVSTITHDQIAALGGQTLCKLSTERGTKRSPLTKLSSDRISQNIDRGGKNGLYPAPFRVLCPVDVPDGMPNTELLNVLKFGWVPGSSTYHTRSRNSDPFSLVWDRLEIRPEPWRSPEETVTGVYHREYLFHAVYQSIHIESELIPKINSKEGNYYSRYCAVGILWQRVASNSLTSLAQYYTLSKPQSEDYVGKWHHRMSPFEHWVSPSFKVSRQDSHFFSALSGAVLTMFQTIRPMCSPAEYRLVLPKLAVVAAINLHSSWFTSVLAGNNRFIVLCHLAESGNMQELIDKVTVVKKELKSCDFILLRLMEDYMNNEASNRKTTPLLGLPPKLMSLEKDMHLGFQWHIRGSEHATECMTKMVDTYLQEKKNRAAIIDWMELQAETLEKMVTSGLEQSDFDMIFDCAPSVPAFNALFFLGLSSLGSQKFVEIGISQDSSQYALWKLCTDHHSVKIDPTRLSVKNTKVADAFVQAICELKTSTPYATLLEIASKPRANDFAMHEKDAKDANREIAIMDFTNRFYQGYKEALTTVFQNNVSSDLMEEPDKYGIVVEEIMSHMGRPAAASSEDRSGFCSNMHPEVMSIATQIIGVVAGSTPLIAAASVQIVNTRRRIVFPMGYKGDPPDNEYEVFTRTHGRETCRTFSINLYNHMLQGIEARGAGVINTVYCVGMQALQRKICPQIMSSYVFTTSDDVVRGATFQKGYDKSELTQYFIEVPNRFLTQVMMKENTTKPIETGGEIAEFNNAVVTPTGLVPQAPINSALAVKPIMSNSIIGDVIDAIAMSRSTILWGSPPEQADAALFSYENMIRAKWFLTEDDFLLLKIAGMWPQTLEQLIEGFFPRDVNVFSRMCEMLDKEDFEALSSGNVNVAKAFYQIGVPSQKKKRYKKIQLPGDMFNSQRVLDGIIASRNLASRANPRYLDPPNFRKRARARTRFMEALDVQCKQQHQELFDKLKPLQVTIQTVRASRLFMRPAKMGASSEVSIPSKKNIISRARYGVDYQRIATEEEKLMSRLSKSELSKAITELERLSARTGLSKKMPGGLPITRTFNGRFFTCPVQINFSMSLPSQPPTAFRLPYFPFTNVKPMIWGGWSLDQAAGCVLAFAYGEREGRWFAAYKIRGRANAVEYLDIPSDVGFYKINTSSCTVAIVTSPDFSPIKVDLLKPSSLLHLVGDSVAILNYGSYIMSSAPGGFALLQGVFSRHRSEFPTIYRTFLPSYPYFPRRATVLTGGRVNYLRGNSYSRFLKLEIDPEMRSQHIDLEGDGPRVYTESMVNMMDEIDD